MLDPTAYRTEPVMAAATPRRATSTAPVRPGDEITAKVEALESRADKPITKLRTTIARADGVVALQGTALVWREELEKGPDR